MEPETILLEDYKQKITYLTGHTTRMWTRFNFFVTIESALIGGRFLIASNVPSRELAVAGMIISACWYFMGAQDRYLFRVYRWQVEKSAQRIAGAIKAPANGDAITKNLFDSAQQAAVDYVGRMDHDLLTRFEEGEAKKQEKDSVLSRGLEKISSWRSKHFSITHLAAFYPLVSLVLWVFMFVISKALP